MVGKFEANKDLIQELVSSGARHVGNIASIISGTVAEVTREIGDWVTDAIEMREAAAAAGQDATRTVDDAEPVVDAEPVDEPGVASEPGTPADAEFDVIAHEITYSDPFEGGQSGLR